MRGVAAPAGNPAALASDVHDLQRVSNAIASAADDLMAALADGDSEAVDALHERARSTRGKLDDAHGRYQGTTSALRDYQVALQTFHTTAQRAIEDHEHAAYRYAVADHAHDEAVKDWRIASMNGLDPTAIERARHEVDRTSVRREAASDEMHAAWQRYTAAASARDAAAERAMARIAASFDGTNDSWKDEVADAIADVAGFIAAIGNWAADVLKSVMTAIEEAIEAIIIAVVAIVVVLAIVALAIVVLAIAVVVVIQVLAVLAFIINVVTTFLVYLGLVALVAYEFADALGLSDQDTIRMVALALGVACPPLGALILNRLLDEALAPTPEVKPYDPSDATETMQTYRDDLDSLVPDDVDDLIHGTWLADQAGGGLNHSDRTVIDIAEIRDPEGNVTGYIVTLPSTMDWVVDSLLLEKGLDPAAINDLDADLLAMLAPEIKGQFERAILEAMEQAGVQKDVPVLMTGFSLGGIMAAHMTETGSGDYEYAGLVVAGSAIDHMQLPDDIPVLQAKHILDGVHQTDLITVGDNSGMHREVWDGPFSPVGVQGTNPITAHDAELYRWTIAAYDVNRELSSDFEPFLLTEEELDAGWSMSRVQLECAE